VAAEGHSSIDALGQFTLETALGPIGRSVNFTQANVMMVVASGLVIALLVLGMRPRAMVPGRLQSAAEIGYEFVMSMCTDQIGHEGKKFFPVVFCLFFFILFGNVLGLFPYFFTFTSHIAITLALSFFVFCLVTFVALKEHGLHFFSYFLPKGIPVAMAPLVILIEIISYLSRIISLSVRLFANMMAGHIILDVFASFVVMLGLAGGIFFIPAGLSLVTNVALFGLELLVATLQAYVFAILTCIYLHDAVHLH
jgi:F-type H+-transporting ATPase subunit a